MPGKVSSKSAGKQKVKGGSGSMHGFGPVGTQTPGQSSSKSTNTGGKFAKGGGTGKIGGSFTPSVPLKPGKSSQR